MVPEPGVASGAPKSSESEGVTMLNHVWLRLPGAASALAAPHGACPEPEAAGSSDLDGAFQPSRFSLWYSET